MLNICTLEERDFKNYNKFLLGNDNSLFYYSLTYRDFLCQTLGCSSEYYVVKDSFGDVQATLPLFIKDGVYGKVVNSLPFYGSHGGILSNKKEATEILTTFYNEYITNQSIVSATIISNLFYDNNTLLTHNITDSRIGQITNISLPSADTSKEEFVMSKIDGNKRNEVRRAQKHGIQVFEENEAIDFVRAVHQEEMMKLNRSYKTNTFFENIPRFFKPKTDYKIFVARYNNEIIAAVLLFYFNKTVEYFTPVILNGFRIYQPMSLLLYHAMLDAINNGYEWFNWGGTWTSQQEGVYRFKKQMGAIDKPYIYYTQLNDDSLKDRNFEELKRCYPGFYLFKV